MAVRVVNTFASNLVRGSGLSSRTWSQTILLLAVAAALRFYKIDGQLWLDEVSALRGYRKPFLETLTTFPPFFPNPLYELMAHASLLLFGESALAIRLPAAVFGVASVIVLYRLALRCLTRGEALFASALFAVSYHHIFFSQDARGYTTFLFFALLATDRLLELLGKMKWRTAIAYALFTALATYAHPFGLFVLAGQMIVALVVVGSRRSQVGDGGPTLRQILGTTILGGLMILTLFAPLVSDAVSYAFTEARTAGHGPRLLEIVPELLNGLLAGFGGWPGLTVATGVGVIGTVDFVRREPVTLALFSVPLVVTGAAVLTLGAGVHPRYFLLALPLGYLLGARGAMLAVRWLVEDVFLASRATSLNMRFGFGLLAVTAACAPLPRYFAMPKQDYVGALRVVRELAEPDDRIVAAAHAGFAYQNYYDPDLSVVDDAEGLELEESSGRRIWVVTTLERQMAASVPDLLNLIHGEYEQVRYLPGSLGDGAMRIYVRSPDQ